MPAENDDRRLRQRVQPRDRSCGTRGDGVVDKRDTVELADALHAVRHTRKAARDLHARRLTDQTVGRSEGSHIVFHVVRAGNADIRNVDQLLRLAAVRAINDAVRAVDAVFHRTDAAEIAHAARRLGRKARRVRIPGVEHKDTVGALAAVNAALGRHIVLQIRMHIQMVGRNVCDNGHIRSAVHTVQLEAAELEHGKIVRPDVRDAVKERRADVAAKVHGIALRTQKLGRDGRGRGLAVAAGDGKDVAGAEIAECLHLGGEDRAVLRSLAQLRHDGQHARRAEDHIKVQMPEIVRTKGKFRALRRGLIPGRAELRALAPVAHGHITAVLQQHTHERLIAHAEADDADALAAQVVNIIRKGHADTPFEK